MKIITVLENEPFSLIKRRRKNQKNTYYQTKKRDSIYPWMHGESFRKAFDEYWGIPPLPEPTGSNPGQARNSKACVLSLALITEQEPLLASPSDAGQVNIYLQHIPPLPPNIPANACLRPVRQGGLRKLRRTRVRIP